MTHRIELSKTSWLLAVAMFVVVSGLLAVASAVEAKGENVTFVNKSGRSQELLTAFGGTGTCSEMPSKKNLRIEPGEEAILESGGSKVCWCAGSGKVPVSQCGEWSKAKPGSKVRIRF